MNTFMLKILALLFMFLDHIHLYFPETPAILTWIGRASYPLFLFCMVWGYHYTKNRKICLLRLYLLSAFMTVFGYTIDYFLPTARGYGNHNIFLPMFLVGIIISIIEAYQKDRKKGCIFLGILFAVQLLFFILPGILPFVRNFNGDIITGIIPNLYINQYGFQFVALGVLMYFLKEKKDSLCIMYVIFCIAQFSEEMLVYGTASQWLMIAALPFIMRYNNQKGYGMKYFFYVFYPAHTFLLFYLANFVLNKA